MELFNKPNIDEIYAATDNLAKKTVMIGMYLIADRSTSIARSKNEGKNNLCKDDFFLSRNEFTLVDSVLFATYYIHLYIRSVSKKKYTEKVSNRYLEFVFQILCEDGGCWEKGIPESTVLEMCENRFLFYNKVFFSQKALNDSMSAIIEEFEYIIKTDIINRKYVPFSSNSPLPILGLPLDFMCQAEVSQFLGFIKGQLDNEMQRLAKLIG